MEQVEYSRKKYIVVVQCHIVAERCPGFFCERSFVNRTGGFAGLPQEQECRVVYLTCGGCCGRALHRKLALLAQKAQKHDGIAKEEILVKFASCISKESYHGPKCPHLEYLQALVAKLGLDVSFDTAISARAEKLRQEGVYEA